MSTTKYEPVVFEDSHGNIISNDPYWKAQQVMAAYEAGQTPVIVPTEPNQTDPSQPIDTTPRPAALVIPPTPATPEPNETNDDDENIDNEETQTASVPRDYKDVEAKDLKPLAIERGVDITGLTKAGQVREALIANDLALAEIAEANKK